MRIVFHSMRSESNIVSRPTNGVPIAPITLSASAACIEPMMPTVGANTPIVGFNPNAHRFRERLRTLAGEPSVDWVDYQ